MAKENTLFMRALRGETVERVPVWMMRQAGRYLPDYQKLKSKYSFWERCQNAELLTEITVMPIEQIGVDAAILFSDILVVPQAMGMKIDMVQGKGPVVQQPIKTLDDVEKLDEVNAHEKLKYVYDGIEAVNKALNDYTPLIGFAGSPWTILCYMVQGEGSKNFDKAKKFCFESPKLADRLLQKITDSTILYLKEKAKAGCNALQIFDSWGGLLSPSDYNLFSWKYINQILEGLVDDVPVIVFGKGCWFAYETMSKSRASGIGVDWTCSATTARKLAGENITLQGNFDPIRLLSPIPEIEKETLSMLKSFGKKKYIANLGHGILPNIPVEHAKTFVNTIKNFS